MTLQWPNKGPLRFWIIPINWSPALNSDTIVTSTWAISDPGLTTTSNTNTSTTTTIWLATGTLGSSYTVVNTVVTAGGRTYVQTVGIKIATT